MLKVLADRFGKDLAQYDTSLVHNLADPAKGGSIPAFAASKSGTGILLVFTAPNRIQPPVTFDVVQEEDNRIVGGNTFVLNAKKPS
jgi:hypothetical protein